MTNRMHPIRADWVAALFCAALLWLVAPASAADVRLSDEEKAWIAARPGPLRVHNEMDWRPYNFVENGVPSGFSIDYIRLVAEKVGLEVDFISGPTWAQFMEMMRTRDLDVMLNIASTRERRQFLAFTEPYYITSVGLYVRRGTDGIADIGDMAGKRLSFPEDFFFDEFIARYYPEIIRTPYPSAPASFRAVAEGEVDAAMDVPGVARSIMAREGLDLKFAGRVSDPRFITTFYIAVHKSEPILRDILQKGMDAISTEEMNILDARWNLQETGTPAALFSHEDKAWLQARGGLTACAASDALPLEGVDRAGVHTGMAADYAALLGQALTVPVTARALPATAPRPTDCDLMLLARDGVDVPAGMVRTAAWLRPELVVATRTDQIYVSDPGQLAGRRLAVVAGQGVGALLRAARPELTTVPVPSVDAGLAAVEDGSVYGLVGDVATLTRALQVAPVAGVKISGSMGLQQPVSLAVREDDPRLLRLVGIAMGSIDRETVEALYRRWLAVAYVDRFDYTRLWQGLAVVLVLGGYAVFRHRKNLRVTAILRQAHTDVAAANAALAEKNRELARLARHDALTGLLNRHALGEALNGELDRLRRYGATVSVILLDVDHFKQINDTHGHQVGDRVLVRLAAVLEDSCRENDLVGRWGGEEFLLLCPSTDADGARQLAEHLRAIIAADRSPGLPTLTASFGLAEATVSDDDDSLVMRADKALYAAKAAGRNCVKGGTGATA